MSWQDRDYNRGFSGGGGGWGYQQPQMRVRFGPVMTPVVKQLLIINIVVFVIDLIVIKFIHSGGLFFFVFDPFYAVHRLFIWQFFTYMFMHGGIFHILINMLILWMLGCDVERRIGGKSFLIMYLASGLFGALFFLVSNLYALQHPHMTGVVGASGAVLGIVFAFGMLFPDRILTLLIAFIIPVRMKAKYLVLGIVIVNILSELSASGSSNVAHMAHLGGMFFAYFYMRFKYGLRLPFEFSQRIADAIYKKRFWKSRRRKYETINSSNFINEEIDPILEKISKHGMKSLSWRERRTLKKARSKMK